MQTFVCKDEYMNNYSMHIALNVCLSKDSTTSFIVFNLTFAVVLSNVKVGKLFFYKKGVKPNVGQK